MKELELIAKKIRYAVLEETVKKGKGHLGGTFSCTDLLVGLYYEILNIDPLAPRSPDRDRFILSKGHACMALYAILLDLGFIDEARYQSYGEEGGLGGQVDINIPGVDWNTGSLGHALGVAAGMAKAALLDKKDYHVTVILGDAECAEGSVWEALLYIGAQKIPNLTCIIDRNRLSVTTVLDDDSFFAEYDKILTALGWDYVELDGHNMTEIVTGLRACRASDKPTMVIANTIKGKGVSFMEQNLKWHHQVPGQAELEIARRELHV